MGLYFLCSLAVTAVLLFTAPTGLTLRVVDQMIGDCEYGEDIADMVYFVKNIVNKKLENMYDSRIGKYVGFDENGIRAAKHYNKQAWKMALRRAEVETLCRYNARLFRRSTLERQVPPTVRVHQTKPVDYGERNVIECSVMGFYPQDLEVTWLRDGTEIITDVSFTDVLANEDWTFQLHAYLELIPKRGERVTCRVDHSSLTESLEVDWDTFALDAKYLKVVLGTISFFVGFTVAVGGGVYYWWKQRFDFSPVGRREQTSSYHSDL
ncbi:H-2 class II histocompatibility antigen, E-S beta chain-like [Solea senegalensis]|uniref:H-2 class II histocompatibility antigen, E-S beta chain-like n=1 Tax=Solea senegalensis TaxID=28829 RepID=A0AAV6PTZ8_SOLSE|nr:H-2 class II histocompatibility antigen, E-S beta chain-like [Solea senegalensis]KAG7474850.1 H-2 class II histocompatibility antigen, E-S beta chain-like [Solea senegalensis]